jgi:hypothetical protein
MKFTTTHICGCGAEIKFSALGNGEFDSTECLRCGTPSHVFDPLSVSVTAERLLNRSQDEMQAGDYSLSILIETMAIEGFLTRLFLKVKGMTKFLADFEWPTLAEEAIWEKEYPRSGGFTRLQILFQKQ